MLLLQSYLPSEQTFIFLHQHLVRLGVWALFSIVFGILVLLVKRQSLAAQHFSLQFIVWGAVDGIIVLFGLRDNSRPDLVAAIKLREFLWLNEGLDVGYIAVGITLIIIGRLPKVNSASLPGAGLAVAIQGFLLLLLDGILLWQLPNISNWINK
jgi:hypothetical protein